MSAITLLSSKAIIRYGRIVFFFSACSFFNPSEGGVIIVLSSVIVLIGTSSVTQLIPTSFCIISCSVDERALISSV